MSKNWGRKSNNSRNRIKSIVYSTKGYKCYLCGGLATTVDHVVPDSYGGSHSVDNLEPCCKDCNSSRGNRPNGDGRFGIKVIPVVTKDYAKFSDYISDRVNKNTDIVISKDLIANAIGFNYNATHLVIDTYLNLIAKAKLITSQCNLFIHVDKLTSDVKDSLKGLNISYIFLDDEAEMVDDW